MSRIFLAASAIFLSGVALAAPAPAQDDSERVNQLIVYGDDPCPPSTADQITVCARKDESERYRIPEPLRDSQSPQNDAWNNRVIAYETVGKQGILSCSPAGAAGWTGCLNQMIETAYAEKGSDPSLRFSDLIAAEREKRLATIDAEADATQERVEEAEKAYEERMRAEREAKEAASGN
ncbi:MAG: hypothetical protein KDE55_10260 [Novosphingobium sp.]|nr:hypothetical protein [Novosphingobium sp.]